MHKMWQKGGKINMTTSSSENFSDSTEESIPPAEEKVPTGKLPIPNGFKYMTGSINYAHGTARVNMDTRTLIVTIISNGIILEHDSQMQTIPKDMLGKSSCMNMKVINIMYL